MKTKTYKRISVLFVLFLIFTALAIKTANSSAVTEANAGEWYNYSDSEIEADDNGNIVCNNGQLYSALPLSVIDNENGVKSVKVEYSLKKETDTTHQYKFVFTGNAIENYNSYKNKLGSAENYIGFALVYGAGKYSQKTIQYGASSDAGNWKNNLYQTFDPLSEDRHSIEIFFSEDGVWAKIDGVDFLKQSESQVYYFVKANGTKYTIADFTADGELKVYLGIDGAYSFKTTIYTKPETDVFIGWKRGDGVKINKTDKNEIITGFGTSGLLYTGNVAEIENVYSDGELRFEAEFSYVSTGREGGQLIPFISKTLFSATDAANSSLVNKAYGIAGLRMYYQTAEHLASGRLLMRASDGKGNYSSVKYVEGKPSSDGARHKIAFVINENEVTISFDGADIGYAVMKNDTEKYTINDFIADGAPQIYFGFINSGFGSLTVYSDWRADTVEEPGEEDPPEEPEITVPDGLPYDNRSFKNAAEKNITPSEDGSVPLNTWVNYYYGNLGNAEFYSKNNALRIKVRMSVDSFGSGAIANAMTHVLFSNKALNNGVGQLPGKYGKEDGSLIDLTLRYVDANAVASGTVTARVLDCAWSSSVTAVITENSEFAVQLDVNEDGAVISINGKQAGGYLYKSTGVKWTLSDFIKTEGEGDSEIRVPQMYFGFVCGAEGYGSDFGPYRVHSVTTEYSEDETPVEVGGFVGIAGTLKSENEKPVLYGGNAYSKQVYKGTGIIKGGFEIAAAPGGDNAFSVMIKDSAKSRNSGNGLSVSYSVTTENDVTFTAIEFGIYVDGKYYALDGVKSNVKLIGKHNFAFIFGNGYYTVVSDGESLYSGIMSSGELMDLSANLDTESLILYYGGDSDSEKGESWKVFLGEAEATADGEYFGLGVNVKTEGDIKTENKVVSANRRITVGNAENEQKGTFIIRAPFAVFPKENRQISFSFDTAELSVSDSVTFIFTATEGGSADAEDDQSFVLKITRIGTDKFKAYAMMGDSSCENEITNESGNFTVTFGFTPDGSAVSLNEKIILEGKLSKGMFVSASGQNGYFSVVTADNSDDGKDATVSFDAPVHYEGDVPNVQNAEPEKSGCDCSASVGISYTLPFVLLAAAITIAAKRKKKRTETK